MAGLYGQAISAHAPHPNAAKLWMEYLYSDEGQLHWLSGYCTPVRFNDMVARGVVPQELLDRLPPEVTEDHRAELLKMQRHAKRYLEDLAAAEKEAEKHRKENL